MVLFGGFHGFDDSGGESVVFQFIDPLDCDSAGVVTLSISTLGWVSLF